MKIFSADLKERQKDGKPVLLEFNDKCEIVIRREDFLRNWISGEQKQWKGLNVEFHVAGLTPDELESDEDNNLKFYNAASYLDNRRVGDDNGDWAQLGITRFNGYCIGINDKGVCALPEIEIKKANKAIDQFIEQYKQEHNLG